MQIKMNMEMRNRSSESSSADSGVITDDTNIVNNYCNIKTDINLSPKIRYHKTDKIDEPMANSKNGVGNDTTSAASSDIEEATASVDNNPTTNNNSPESTRISIASINDDDADSSIIESDSDFDEIVQNGEFIIQKLGQHMTESDKKNGVIVVSQNNLVNKSESATVSTENSRPQIGSIAVQNSTDITFGDKTFYQGPVTIKQFLLENNKWKPKNTNGSVNPAFDENDVEKSTGNPMDKQSIVDHKKYKFRTKAITITSGIVFIIFIMLTIILTSVLLTKSKSLNSKLGDGDDSRINNPVNSTIGEDNIGGGTVLRLVSRAEWVAQPPMHKLNDLELPAKKVIIAHTATEYCDSQARCAFHIRYIQLFHMESQGWDDIGYNFLVGGDGSAYEGRGWNKEGAHTKGFNKRSICIAFIGTFIETVPLPKQLNAAKLLIAEGIRMGKIAEDYKLYAHRQLIPSESPGQALYEIIQKWPHWTNETDTLM